MQTVFSDDHNLHGELLDPRGSDWIPSAECPARANNVLTALREHNFSELRAPKHFPDEDILTIHDPEYVSFLQTVWDEWLAAGGQATNARPDTFVGRDMRWVETESIYGKLGRYSFDATSPFVEGSWQAIRTSANIALTAAELIRDGATLIENAVDVFIEMGLSPEPRLDFASTMIQNPRNGASVD